MIESISDLQRLFKLCRKLGVFEFKMNGVEFKIKDMPESPSTGSQQEIDSEEPSEEDIMYWSSPQGQQDIAKKVGIR